MSDSVDSLIKEWATSVHPGISLSLEAPTVQKSGRGVSVYLMEVLHTPTHLTARPSPLELSLRYLVTSWGETPEEAHQLLSDLAFSALANRDFQVDLDAVPAAIWTAFGLPPLPSFVVRVPLRQARIAPSSKLVNQKLQISSTTVVQLHGVVLGPNDTPIADSSIEIPTMRLTARSDYRGRFHFSGVPLDGTKSLRVRARGRELNVECEGTFADEREPFVIHFTPLEN
jgi:hypothetical protein